MDNRNKPVQHDGEFVLTCKGSRDFGEISPELAREIGRRAGKIRLRIGKQSGKRGNYGEKHIERPDRREQLRRNGYKNARDLAQEAASGYTAIYARKNSGLTLYKKKGKKGLTLFIDLISSPDGDYYDVKTAMITRDSYYHNKKPLWESQSGKK